MGGTGGGARPGHRATTDHLRSVSLSQNSSGAWPSRGAVRPGIYDTRLGRALPPPHHSFWRIARPQTFNIIDFRVWVFPKTTWKKTTLFLCRFLGPGSLKNNIENHFRFVSAGLRAPPFWRIAQPPGAAHTFRIIDFRAWAAQKRHRKNVFSMSV